MGNFIYTRWWRFGWLIIYISLTVIYFVTLNGNIRLVAGGIAAFVTGYHLCFATALYDWHEISNGWRDLYERTSHREQRWAELYEDKRG